MVLMQQQHALHIGIVKKAIFSKWFIVFAYDEFIFISFDGWFCGDNSKKVNSNVTIEKKVWSLKKENKYRWIQMHFGFVAIIKNVWMSMEIMRSRLKVDRNRFQKFERGLNTEQNFDNYRLHEKECIVEFTHLLKKMLHFSTF